MLRAMWLVMLAALAGAKRPSHTQRDVRRDERSTRLMKLVDDSLSPLATRERPHLQPRLIGCALRAKSTRDMDQSCHFSDVCFSRRDGLLVPNTTAGLQSMVDTYNKQHSPSSTSKARILPLSRFLNMQRVFMASGQSYVANCWRMGATQSNPAHYMIGHGKIFVAALHPAVPRGMNNLIFQQCSISDQPNASFGWGWAQAVWKVIESKGVDSGLWRRGKVNIVKLGASKLHARYIGQPSDFPRDFETVVCTRDVHMQPDGAPLYLGSNSLRVVSEWHAHVQRTLGLPALNTTNTPLMKHSTSMQPVQTKLKSICAAGCSSNMRVALWRRSNGNRQLINTEQIAELVSEYSSIPLQMVSASEKTPFLEQISIFRSFDIVITPHGSHNVNQLFSHQATVFIEVIALLADDAPCMNGRAFAHSWLKAFGAHLPVVQAKLNGSQPSSISHHSLPRNASSALWTVAHGAVESRIKVERMQECHANAHSCPFSLQQAFKDASLLVDMARLRWALERAIAIRCGCRLPEFLCGRRWHTSDGVQRAPDVAPYTMMCCDASCQCDGCAGQLCRSGSAWSCPRDCNWSPGGPNPMELHWAQKALWRLKTRAQQIIRRISKFPTTFLSS